jgi:hypothetical protein
VKAERVDSPFPALDAFLYLHVQTCGALPHVRTVIGAAVGQVVLVAVCEHCAESTRVVADGAAVQRWTDHMLSLTLEDADRVLDRQVQHARARAH